MFVPGDRAACPLLRRNVKKQQKWVCVASRQASPVELAQECSLVTVTFWVIFAKEVECFGTGDSINNVSVFESFTDQFQRRA